MAVDLGDQAGRQREPHAVQFLAALRQRDGGGERGARGPVSGEELTATLGAKPLVQFCVIESVPVRLTAWRWRRR